MKPIARFSSLLLCGALPQACSLDTGPVSRPSGVVAADVVGEEQPTWGPWATPINLGPVVNSPADDNRPAISKDGLALVNAHQPRPARQFATRRQPPSDFQGRPQPVHHLRSSGRLRRARHLGFAARDCR